VRIHRALGLIAVLVFVAACDEKASKQLDDVRAELASLKTPAGVTAADAQVSLGEMDAFASQTYCAADEKAGRAALDSMLRAAGWEPVAASGIADATTLAQYHKGVLRAVLRVEAD
jgi:hypothetical protein